jgi:hypothetical protein
LQVGQDVASPLQHRRGRPALAQTFNFFGESVAVARQIGGKLRKFARDEPTQPEDDGERAGHHNDDGEDTRHAEAPQENQRPGQNETQQDGKSERDKHLAPDIKGGDDERCDEHALQDCGARVRVGGEHRDARSKLHVGPKL